jgi:MYXO-CTERM domain-containing protein
MTQWHAGDRAAPARPAAWAASLAALVLMAAGAGARAGQISITLVGKYTQTMGPGEQAGVAPLADWNSATPGSGTLTGLVDDSGAATGASVTWWGKTDYTGITDAAGNNRMMRGYLTSFTDRSAWVEVSGLTSVFPSGAYDVIVYFDGANGANAWETSYRIGAVALTGRDLPNTTFSGTFSADTGLGGNYVRFGGVTGDHFRLDVVALAGGGTPINGIQIVHSPEPGSLGLAALGLALALARRRGR